MFHFVCRHAGLGKALLQGLHKGQKDKVSPRGGAYEASSKGPADKADFNSRPNTSKPVKRQSVVHSNGVNSGFRIVDKTDSAASSRNGASRPPVKLPPVARNMPGSANSTSTLVHVNDVRQ